MLRSRDDRRRRALVEESALREGAEPQEPTIGGGAQVLYSQDAQRCGDLRLRDLIPRRKRILAICGTLWLLATTLILVAIYYQQDCCERLGVASLPAIDPRLPNNLAAWLTSMTLGLTGGLAGLIYTWRQYRLDDYRGRYRLWLIGAMFYGTLSVGVVAPVHKLWELLMVQATGFRGWDEGSVWWIGPLLVIGAGFGIRISLELARCPVALGKFLPGNGLILLAGVAQNQTYLPSLPPFFASYACALVGSGLVMLGLCTYARHVLLEIDGVIKPRARQPQAEKPTRKRKSGETVRIDAAHTPESDKPAKSTSSPAASSTAKSEKPTSDGKVNPSGVTSQSQPVKTPAATPTTKDANPATKNSTGNVNRPHAFGTKPPGPLAGAIHQQQAKATVSANYTDDTPDSDDDDEGDDTGGNRKLSRAERKRLRKLRG
ncbi:MAG: hypothetical protein SFX18_15530 [Pirellulales bacterium]|nr:hypothetical protein [Pirellulales bacterium]